MNQVVPIHLSHWRRWLALGLMCMVPALVGLAQDSDDDYLDYLMEGATLEELMDVAVVSASKFSESLADAPATIIVIDRQTILRRGYLRLSEIFYDLPGMDVVRPWGDDWTKNYWRGYRNTVGSPYLLMVDGVILNHLYFNSADEMAALPMSNIDRIEVVYGPASAVYGANAFMGVINIVTVKVPEEDGWRGDVRVNIGSHGQHIIDGLIQGKRNQWSLTLAYRADNGETDPSMNENYEYTQDQYLTNQVLWGGFLDDPGIAGKFYAPFHHRTVDLRLERGDWQLVFRHFKMSNRTGVNYAADQVQMRSFWIRDNSSIYVRHDRQWNDRVHSTTTLRYRESNVDPNSSFIEAVETSDALGNPIREVVYSNWRADNSSWSLYSDWEFKVNERFTVIGGIKWERKDLQKAYALAFGPQLLPSLVDISTYAFPTAADLDASEPAFNRIDTTDAGVFLTANWDHSENHSFHLGVRWDHNSEYGSFTTIRGGYVGHFDRWSFKVLYGEAFQEPNPRLLYGGWAGSGSDPDLKPESSKTYEVSGSYTSEKIRHMVSAYQVDSSDTLINTSSGAQNLGNRTLIGLDYHFELLADTEHLGRLRFWGYLSHIFTQKESKLDDTGMVIGSGRIGDLAQDKVQAGVSIEPSERWMATLRGRFIGPRPTVESNPLGQIAGYSVFDGLIRYQPSQTKGWSFTLRISNLLDKTYFHPGVRDAEAGDIPGFFDALGVWQGSKGFFSSALAQPGREFSLGVRYVF